MKKIALMVFGLLVFSGMAVADEEDTSTEGSVSLVSEVSGEEFKDAQSPEVEGVDDSEMDVDDESIAVEIEADQPDEVEEEEEESEEEGEDDLDGMD